MGYTWETLGHLLSACFSAFPQAAVLFSPAI